MGVRGMKLSDTDRIISMIKTSESEQVIIVSESGYGKRTLVSDFRLQSRAGKGIKAYKITEKTGNIAGVVSVTDDDELLMINSVGTMIRIRVDDVSILSRVTSGVKMIRIDKDEDIKVAAIAKVKEKFASEEVNEELEEESVNEDTE